MQISFPEELPVSGLREEIADAIREHQVVIVAGETGSGKTTQLPKICLALGRGVEGSLIGHTQPRRLAARTVAERIAAETGTTFGETVGYQVRFNDRTASTTRVKVMTDGILLAELQHDRELRRYDTLIIDEAHERSLNIDFILGYLKRLLPRRPDLKVIITSATIDHERFASHFAADGVPAPVIEVTGRTYPVEVRYRPLVEVPEDDEDGEVLVRDQTEAITDAVRELLPATPGDILVFLPGEREIRDTADALSSLSQGPRGFDVVPLFARLSIAEQHRVFEAHTRRRVVLATNVAETSLTVPGITAVIDTGLARISRYSARTKVQRLPIEPISQASANQRSGRCGRIGPGIAIRLYSEEDFRARPAFTEPEILRTSLAAVMLQMAALRLGEVGRFPFLEPPDSRNVKAGQVLLAELGAFAVSRNGPPRLTRIGRSLARLPIDPQLGRMLIAADRNGCLREMLVVAAALSVQDPRERPEEKRAQADQAHARFADPASDFLSWLRLWDYLREAQQERSSSAFRRMCREEYLNYLRVREWQDYEQQLRQVVRQIGLTLPRQRPTLAESLANADALHRSLLTGLLSHIGLRDRDRREYLGARGTRFAIFPGSGLSRKQPDFVVAAELVETSRLWARQVAAVDPRWVEEAAGELVSRSYSEPHWSKRRAAVVARERVTLYGVPLIADRTVSYAKVDPDLCRELFIRHALVGGEWQARHKFLETNRALLDDAAEWEHRARRRDLVVDEETLVAFYDRVLPADIVSGGHFDGWWKKARRETPELLTFDPAMLLHDTVADLDPADYPDEWSEGAARFPVRYRFEPGTADDGVRIELPLASLNTIDDAPFSWQVPGLRHELVTALLRSLPKHLRVNFVPAPQVAAEFLAAVTPGHEPLLVALTRYLRARSGVVVPDDSWDWAKVPDHLRPTFQVLAEDGSVLSEGKDLSALKAPLRSSFEAAVAEAAAQAGLASSGHRDWEVGTLPATFTESRAGHDVVGFPALHDDADSVSVVVLGSPAEQQVVHPQGLRRLLLIALAPDRVARDLAEGLRTESKLILAAAPGRSLKELLADCVIAACDQLIADHAGPGGSAVRDPQQWQDLLAAVRTELPQRSREVRELAERALSAARNADRALHGTVALPQLPALNDMRQHYGRLLAPGFVVSAGAAHLVDYPRYLGALVERRRRLEESLDRDARLQASVQPFQDALDHQIAARPSGEPLLADTVRLRWLIEEFRVSLWAQQWGTREPVSEKRLRALVGG